MGLLFKLVFPAPVFPITKTSTICRASAHCKKGSPPKKVMIDLQIFRWRGFIYNYVGELVKMVVAEDDGEDGGDDGVGCLPVTPEKTRGTVGQPEGE